MDHGTSQGGRVGTKENVLGRARRKTGQYVGLADGGLALYLRLGLFTKETQKGTLLPIFLFRSQS